MIGIDTNILVYAYRADSPWNTRAIEVVTGLANGRPPWALPWPCVHEFLGIVTRPGVYKTPTPLDVACAQMAELLRSPSVVLLAEDAGFWRTFEPLLVHSNVTGAAVHDARIAALCLHHGVTTLLSADRGFTRFPLKTQNPLL